jgi:hypothetical protein
MPNTTAVRTAQVGAAPFFAGKNKIINGDMNIWQRGTSASVAASTFPAFSADRWVTSTNANQACTISRQATGDTTNLPNIQYCLRYQRNSGQTGTGGLLLIQNFETINSIPFAGKTVTFSFYARKGANYSATNSELGVLLITGTGTDQNAFNGFTGSATPINSVATLTTTWQRFSYTATLATNITQIAPDFSFTPTGTAGAADYYEVTGVQLEAGSVATAFQTATGTIQGELAACQRYYTRFSVADAYHPYCNGQTSSTSNGYVILPLPVTMRVAPTVLDTSAVSTLEIFYESTSKVLSAIAIDRASDKAVPLVCTISSATSGKPVFLRNSNSTSAYIGVSAEL